MRAREVADRLDDRLRTADFADIDASANGLQVGPADAEVDRVALAVDAAVDTAEAARDRDADLFVTHHGLVWGGLDRVTGRTYDRLAPFFEGDLALYVAHLPLDAHPELGNAAGLADRLGITGREPFGAMGSEHLGVRGRLMESTTPDGLRDRLANELDTGDGTVRSLDFGPERIRNVAVLTGAGADFLDEAAATGVDAFVTGEAKGRTYHEAREAGLNVLLAGHYATETAGVRRVGDVLEEWGIETTFVSHPTGL